jgi:hypothetical protein
MLVGKAIKRQSARRNTEIVFTANKTITQLLSFNDNHHITIFFLLEQRYQRHST